jgi:hypothetical protein
LQPALIVNVTLSVIVAVPAKLELDTNKPAPKTSNATSDRSAVQLILRGMCYHLKGSILHKMHTIDKPAVNDVPFFRWNMPPLLGVQSARD